MYMLQEVDILEDWTAIQKVGPAHILGRGVGRGVSYCPPPVRGTPSGLLFPNPGAGSRVPSEEESGW